MKKFIILGVSLSSFVMADVYAASSGQKDFMGAEESQKSQQQKLSQKQILEFAKQQKKAQKEEAKKQENLAQKAKKFDKYQQKLKNKEEKLKQQRLAIQKKEVVLQDQNLQLPTYQEYTLSLNNKYPVGSSMYFLPHPEGILQFFCKEEFAENYFGEFLRSFSNQDFSCFKNEEDLKKHLLKLHADYVEPIQKKHDVIYNILVKFGCKISRVNGMIQIEKTFGLSPDMDRLTYVYANCNYPCPSLWKNQEHAILNSAKIISLRESMDLKFGVMTFSSPQKESSLSYGVVIDQFAQFSKEHKAQHQQETKDQSSFEEPSE